MEYLSVGSTAGLSLGETNQKTETRYNAVKSARREHMDNNLRGMQTVMFD